MSKNGFLIGQATRHDANERVNGVFMNPINAPSDFGVLVSFFANNQGIQFFFDATLPKFVKRAYWESWGKWDDF